MHAKEIYAHHQDWPCKCGICKRKFAKQMNYTSKLYFGGTIVHPPLQSCSRLCTPQLYMCSLPPYHAYFVYIRPNKPQSRFDSYSISVGHFCGSVPGHLHLGGDNPGESRWYQEVLVSLERAKRSILTLPSSHQQMIQRSVGQLGESPRGVSMPYPTT